MLLSLIKSINKGYKYIYEAYNDINIVLATILAPIVLAFTISVLVDSLNKNKEPEQQTKIEKNIGEFDHQFQWEQTSQSKKIAELEKQLQILKNQMGYSEQNQQNLTPPPSSLDCKKLFSNKNYSYY